MFPISSFCYLYNLINNKLRRSEAHGRVKTLEPMELVLQNQGHFRFQMQLTDYASDYSRSSHQHFMH